MNKSKPQLISHPKLYKPIPKPATKILKSIDLNPRPWSLNLNPKTKQESNRKLKLKYKSNLRRKTYI